jgi:hypothetical protein
MSLIVGERSIRQRTRSAISRAPPTASAIGFRLVPRPFGAAKTLMEMTGESRVGRSIRDPDRFAARVELRQALQAVVGREYVPSAVDTEIERDRELTLV